MLLTSIVWVLAGFCILFFYVDCIGPYGCGNNQSTASSLAIQNGSSFSEQYQQGVGAALVSQVDQQASARSFNIRGRMANINDNKNKKTKLVV